jgi:hypothetical protein
VRRGLAVSALALARAGCSSASPREMTPATSALARLQGVPIVWARRNGVRSPAGAARALAAARPGGPTAQPVPSEPRFRSGRGNQTTSTRMRIRWREESGVYIFGAIAAGRDRS